METSKDDEERFAVCTGSMTEEEMAYLIKTGQVVEKNGTFMDVSTLMESGFDSDLDESKENISPVNLQDERLAVGEEELLDKNACSFFEPSQKVGHKSSRCNTLPLREICIASTIDEDSSIISFDKSPRSELKSHIVGASTDVLESEECIGDQNVVLDSDSQSFTCSFSVKNGINENSQIEGAGIILDNESSMKSSTQTALIPKNASMREEFRLKDDSHYQNLSSCSFFEDSQKIGSRQQTSFDTSKLQRSLTYESFTTCEIKSSIGERDQTIDMQAYRKSRKTDSSTDGYQGRDFKSNGSSDRLVADNTDINEDLEDTIYLMDQVLAKAEAMEAEETEIQMVEETPVKESPFQFQHKRLIQLRGKKDGLLFSPSPPRPGTRTLPPALSPIFKTPSGPPIHTNNYLTPPVLSVARSTAVRNSYAHVQAKVDSGLRKPSSSMERQSTVADSKASPSTFQRVTGVPYDMTSAGKSASKIPRPRLYLPLPQLSGSSKYNSEIATDKHFKAQNYSGPKRTMLNNASFEKYRNENHVAESHTGVRDEMADASIVQGIVVPKRFI